MVQSGSDLADAHQCIKSLHGWKRVHGPLTIHSWAPLPLACNTNTFQASAQTIIPSDLAARCPVQMPCRTAVVNRGLGRRLDTVPAKHGCSIRTSASHPLKVCPNMWLQVCNCVDSDLIIIKTTCITGCGPCNGADFLIKSLNWATVEKGGRRGHMSECVLLTCRDLWLINNLCVCQCNKQRI